MRRPNRYPPGKIPLLRLPPRYSRGAKAVWLGGQQLLSELRIVAQMEGRPRPRLYELAALLHLSQSAAWRVLNRLHSSGMIQYVTAVARRRGDDVESITYLKCAKLESRVIAELEARILMDPAIEDAACISGDYDYRISAVHPNVASAMLWHCALVAIPGVIDGDFQLVRTRFSRPNYAAAILGSSGDHR